jgi:3-methyladenine DNA glycosylase AlkD
MQEISLTIVLTELQNLSSAEHFAQLSRFGIKDSNAFGVKIPDIRQLARKIGKNHELAIELWETGIHEARLLAGFIDNPKQVSVEQFDKWVHDFDSWDICDQTCSLFVKTPFALEKIKILSESKEVFVKRTSFVLMCAFAIMNKKSDDSFFYPFFEIIQREAGDDRNFVKKAANWALRQMGKKNDSLRLIAIEYAQRILSQDSKSAHWIARDALRELNNPNIIARIQKKSVV